MVNLSLSPGLLISFRPYEVCIVHYEYAGVRERGFLNHFSWEEIYI